MNSLEVGVEPELFLSSLDAVGKRASRWRTGGTYITTTHKAHNNTHFQQALCSFGEEIQTENCNIYSVNEVDELSAITHYAQFFRVCRGAALSLNPTIVFVSMDMFILKCGGTSVVDSASLQSARGHILHHLGIM